MTTPSTPAAISRFLLTSLVRTGRSSCLLLGEILKVGEAPLDEKNKSRLVLLMNFWRGTQQPLPFFSSSCPLLSLNFFSADVGSLTALLQHQHLSRSASPSASLHMWRRKEKTPLIHEKSCPRSWNTHPGILSSLLKSFLSAQKTG